MTNTDTTDNPWKLLDHERVSDNPNREERHIEHSLVEVEYRGTPDSRTCHGDGCNGTMYWRATVGAMQCEYRCGALATSGGRKIR